MALMKPWYRHFTLTALFCLAAVAAAWFVGGWPAVATVVFLTILETSLSFDNAVVNASVLAHWDAAWRRRFLTWGMLVAVFGMRLVFPVLIVAAAGGISPWRAVDLAVNFPGEYSRMLSSVHHQVVAFGGTFLMMVFVSFFVAQHKTEHWLGAIERPLTRLGKMEAIQAAFTLLMLLAASHLIGSAISRAEFVVAGVWGLVAYIFVKGLTALVGGSESDGPHPLVRQGISGFLYLEVLDASFSFDGVVGALALTQNLAIIALGLSAGAMFVRSFTLLLVERGTLDTYRYLEHGAFWAVGALAVIMLVGVEFDIPEALTGLIGAALIVLALISSVRANRRTARRATAAAET